MNDFMCNLLIMGKTGTGKSSLLNYLCGQTVAETGAGKPVTGEGIYKYRTRINNQYVNMYDSWGIEAGKTKEWNTILNEALSEHGVDKPVTEWFHSVIYCIQAGGARVEDVDRENLKRFIEDGYKVIAVLTKADQLDDESDRDQMKNIIRGIGPDIKIILTCAEEKITRSGPIKQFGREELVSTIFGSWMDSVKNRMPDHIIARLKSKIDDWGEIQKKEIASLDVSVSEDKNYSLYSKFLDSANEFYEILLDKEFKNVIGEALESCQMVMDSFRGIFIIHIANKRFSLNSTLNSSGSLLEKIWSRIRILFKSSSSIRTEQRNKLFDYVDDLAERMKKDIDKEKTNITRIISEALSESE